MVVMQSSMHVAGMRDARVIHGRLLDSLLHLYFSSGFERMTEEHFKTEITLVPRLVERGGGSSI